MCHAAGQQPAVTQPGGRSGEEGGGREASCGACAQSVFAYARDACVRSRHPDTLVSINNLGQLLKDQGDLEGAAPLMREALEARCETLGE